MRKQTTGNAIEGYTLRPHLLVSRAIGFSRLAFFVNVQCALLIVYGVGAADDYLKS
jgi:hypothetical protein